MKTSDISHHTSDIPHRALGGTIVEVLAGVIVLGGFLTLLLPAVDQNEKQAHIAQCAANQKQLAGAALKYAEDFEGKFFYHWTNESDPDGKPLPRELVGGWYDEKRVGRYMNGQPMSLQFPPHPPRWPEGKVVDLGLGGDSFACPGDLPDAGRSYDMNYWGTTRLESDVAKARERETARRMRELGAIWKPASSTGKRFDASVRWPDRILLFADAFETIKTSDDWWVTATTIGIPAALPGERFGGRKEGLPGAYGGEEVNRRYGVLSLPTQLDYTRHGNDRDRHLPVGALNIAFVDGHVALMNSEDLYNSDAGASTYKVLWSEIDKAIENTAIHGEADNL